MQTRTLGQGLTVSALGYAHGLTGKAFTAATEAAIRRLQAAHAEDATGQLLIGAVVFGPGPIRVTSLETTVAVGATVSTVQSSSILSPESTVACTSVGGKRSVSRSAGSLGVDGVGGVLLL